MKKATKRPRLSWVKIARRGNPGSGDGIVYESECERFQFSILDDADNFDRLILTGAKYVMWDSDDSTTILFKTVRDAKKWANTKVQLESRLDKHTRQAIDY